MVANTNIFEDVIYEEISYCDTDEFAGGLVASEILYCPINKIDRLVVPSVYGSFESAGKISQKILCKENYGFKKIKALVDTSELSSGLDGQIGRKNSSSDLELMILGTRAKLIGFSRKTRQVPLIFIVKDQNGKYFVFGTLVSPAFVSGFDLKTGKKYEDESGASIKLTANTIIYEYTNQLPVIIPDPEPDEGDFDTDFQTDFD